MGNRSVEPAAAGRPGPLRRGWGGWLAAGIGALCFLTSIGNDFVYDDLPIVRDNPRIRGLANTSEIWLSDWWAPQTAQQEVTHRHRDRLYRPLVMHTFALNYAVGRLVPAGYHLVNVLLHAAVCLLVWRLAQRLFDDAAISTCAALLFAVHPIHAEAVTSVVGRAELLAALLLLLALLVLLPVGRVPGRARAAGAALLFLAALFSKETAVCYVPVALIALHAAAKKPRRGVRRWWLMHTAVLLAPLVIYLPLRYVALDQHLLRDMPPDVLMNPLVWADLPHRWLHALTIVGHYARLLVLPVKLSCNYGLEVIDPQRGPELLTLVGLLTVGAATGALLGYRRTSVVWRRLAILTAMSIASYVLISNTVLVIGVSLAERLLYWPSVPMLLAIAVGVVHLWRHATEQGKLSRDAARLVWVCGLLFLVGLGLRSGIRATDWSSNLSLFRTDVRVYPQSAELNTAVANALLRRIHDSRGADDTGPLLETARKHLEAAVRINPRSARAWQLRGRVLGMLGDRPGAIASFEEATRHGVLDHVSQMFLARLRDEFGEEAARAARLAEQVTTRPADLGLRLEYGELLLERGHYPEALAELQAAEQLAPENADVLLRLGVVYIRLNEAEKAAAALRQAAARNPSNWETHFYLAGLLGQRGDAEACLRHAQEAFRLEPTRRDTAQNLAEALASNNRIEDALALYRQIESSLSPDDPSRRTIQMRISELERGLP